MPDINIKCAKCGKEIRISDRVDITKRKCSNCGEFLTKPADAPETPAQEAKKASLKLSPIDQRKKHEPEKAENKETDTPEKPKRKPILKESPPKPKRTLSRMTYENENKNTEEETAPEESDVDAVGSVEQETPKKGITHHMISWAVFILLGSAMAYLRYGGKTSEATLEQIKTFAPFVVLLIYVIIVLQAFKDAVSQGIITFLLPPYAFYYLFLVSDNFYMRAVVGAILIAMGEDAVMTYKDVAIDVFGHVNHWLRTIGYGD